MNTKSSKPPRDGSDSEQTWFACDAAGDPSRQPETVMDGGMPRVRRADRQQVVLRALSLEDELPDDHPARMVWAYVERLDLSPLYAQIRAVEGGAGRTATDPQIFMALWLYATLEGVGSARQLDGLCKAHAAYRWICGDVGVNYHTLADFRTAHGDFLDDLLTQSVATLVHQDIVELKRVAIDGMRVRASAGASSFRRGKSLKRCLAEAEEQVECLRAELESDPASSSRRHQAARERAASERMARVQQALAQLPEVRSKKKARDRDKARVSTTDADARVMKMPDGGYRPAYNVRLATDTSTQVITGVDVTNVGSDQGGLAPMVEQHEQRYDQRPQEALADGGFAKKEDIQEVSPPQGNTVVYAPAQAPKDEERDPHLPLEDDPPAVAEWRQRMGTEQAKQIYRERASTAECVNAAARNRGLRQFVVRGLPKARAVILWYALAHNLARAIALGLLA